ncbi:sensor histidine kinase [Paeniglutamicibacter sp. ABSL32-1]|uniref:sensor histidine kinase n=1 Tax=Paeniglutamicibacter quisquiliarum TaxID=2849498 RepID=UPI001C2D39BD|nr:sensor histidine kinase [Paeniglutamicibacter quisquiliarum]MBV1779736.1 sensor histidine kinase [Paeniglutamicibacter quisquiliarum]
MSKRSDARIRDLLASMASIASDLSVTAVTHRVLDEAMSIYAASSGLLELTSSSHQQGQLAKGKDALALREPAGKDEPKRLRLELRTRQELFALLTLGPKNGKDRYSKADAELGAALAGSASVALQNAQLYQDAADRARWLTACARIGGLLGGESRHHTQGLNDVAELARRESRARYALLLTPIAQGQGAGPGYRIAGISQNVHPHLAGRVLLNVGELHRLRLHANNPLVLPTPEPVLPLGEIADGAHTLVAALGARGTHYGLLLMVRGKGAEEYGPVETQMAGIFADNIAQGLGLVQMHHLREDVLLYRERERIARDLHDIVIQRIFAAGLGISALRRQLPTPAARERAAGIAAELDTTIAELRATIYSLRGQAGETESPSFHILRAIRRASSPLDFTPELRLGEGLDALADETTLTHLLAVITEALSNVVRHARAHAVELAIECTDGTLALTLRDDGVGFGAPVAESGLANLRQRAAELGGTLAVDSAPGEGTTLRWVVPMPAER